MCLTSLYSASYNSWYSSTWSQGQRFITAHNNSYTTLTRKKFRFWIHIIEMMIQKEKITQTNLERSWTGDKSDFQTSLRGTQVVSDPMHTDSELVTAEKVFLHQIEILRNIRHYCLWRVNTERWKHGCWIKQEKIWWQFEWRILIVSWDFWEIVTCIGFTSLIILSVKLLLTDKTYCLKMNWPTAVHCTHLRLLKTTAKR